MTLGYVLLYWPKPNELRFRKYMGGPMGWWTADPTQLKLCKDRETAAKDQEHIAKILPPAVSNNTRIARIVLEIEED